MHRKTRQYELTEKTQSARFANKMTTVRNAALVWTASQNVQKQNIATWRIIEKMTTLRSRSPCLNDLNELSETNHERKKN